MITITGKEQLEEFVWEFREQITIVMFGASWCEPCKILKETLNMEKVYSSMPKATIGYINVDDEENISLCEEYNIKKLPSVCFFKTHGGSILLTDIITGTNFEKILEIYLKK